MYRFSQTASHIGGSEHTAESAIAVFVPMTLAALVSYWTAHWTRLLAIRPTGLVCANSLDIGPHDPSQWGKHSLPDNSSVDSARLKDRSSQLHPR